MGFHRFLGIHTVVEAELYAIMTGLKMGRQMGFRRFALYFDSLDAINFIMRDCYIDHPLRLIIGEIRDLLFQDWDVEIHYSPRNNIACADYMARLGHEASDVTNVALVPTIPQGCLHMVLRDQMSCN
ncbi:hypothetical protein QN277_003879 [Acacia crassicarpa]|uniref:RNase H type-1 domain-containing protein n=1 Tax=Acacia crassicarpa TaxID=499986 RepID=A0AAE1K095_9FABA|nr:hypothetical protein QN277_003879 [Acacia crassicarpa]